MSVVNEKQVFGDVELTEGIIVDVSKGRLAIFKATILKVFGKYSLCHLTQITSSSYSSLWYPFERSNARYVNG